MTRPVVWLLVIAVGAGLIASCASSEPSRRRRTRSSDGGGATAAVDDHGRCTADGERLEVSEYDTSGDDTPDVRRVFRRIGDGPLMRLVLSCREADLNGDGVKDVVRFYNDDGRPLREESDRDFDGTIDTITVFQNGRVVRTEIDENHDGRVDAKVYYDESGATTRTERDLAGRSTADTWHPDRWEYYEDGRMVRMGTDVDGDGRVDRWDRDGERAPEPGGGAASSGAASSGGASPPSGTSG
jgi:hypothetical protein